MPATCRSMPARSSSGSTISDRVTEGRDRKASGVLPVAGPNTSGPKLITWPRNTERSWASTWISRSTSAARSSLVPMTWRVTSVFRMPRPDGLNMIASLSTPSRTR